MKLSLSTLSVLVFFFNLHSAFAVSPDLELQLAAAGCQVPAVQAALEKGANPLMRMGESADNSFEMTMRSLGLASNKGDLDQYQNCLLAAEKIRSAVNSGNYSLKIIKLAETEPVADTAKAEETGFRIGEHKFEVSANFSYAYVDSDTAGESSTMEIGGKLVHTWGPWTNTLDIDLDYEEGEDESRKSHVITLEGRRVIFDDYTFFALVSDLRNLDSTRSRNAVVGVGREFENLWGTGVKYHLDLGVGYTETEDVAGVKTGSGSIYLKNAAERKLWERLNGRVEHTYNYAIDGESRTSNFKLAFMYCVDEKCRIEVGPSYQRIVVRTPGNPNSTDSRVNAEVNAKF